jgi:hypothetical protein
MITCESKPVTVNDLRRIAMRFKSGRMDQRRNNLTRFPGICEAAVKLGVSRNHLYFVAAGLRRSPRIESSTWFKKVRVA